MKFQINLSRRPFYNRRLFWLLFFAAMGAIGLFSAWTFQEIVRNESEIRRLQSEAVEQRRKLKDFESRPVKGSLSLTEEQINQLQAAAVLIEERNFSWTAMLEEFERSLTPEIRITSIRFGGDKFDLETIKTGLVLNVKLYAKSPEDVTKMISKLDKGNIFRVEPKSQFALAQSGETGFDLEVRYIPKRRRSASSADNAKPKIVKEVSRKE